MNCPLCEQSAKPFHRVDGVDYFDCPVCDFIFADRSFLDESDSGGASRVYKEEYWRMELEAARLRSVGPSLTLFAEAVLYCRLPIKRVIDIGTGPGFLPATLQRQLPSSAHKFYGVEMFPPPLAERAKLTVPQNYVHGSAGDLTGSFEFGTCIEVMEHLTPSMIRRLADQMASISVPGSLFAINTGLTDYVRLEGHLDYLDPLIRGHITSWSIRSIDQIFGLRGFRVHPLHGRTWAFLLEYEGDSQRPWDRLWSCLPENKELLEDRQTNSLMYVSAINSSMAHAYEAKVRGQL